MTQLKDFNDFMQAAREKARERMGCIEGDSDGHGKPAMGFTSHRIQGQSSLSGPFSPSDGEGQGGDSLANAFPPLSTTSKPFLESPGVPGRQTPCPSRNKETTKRFALFSNEKSDELKRERGRHDRPFHPRQCVPQLTEQYLERHGGNAWLPEVVMYLKSLGIHYPAKKIRIALQRRRTFEEKDGYLVMKKEASQR